MDVILDRTMEYRFLIISASYYYTKWRTTVRMPILIQFGSNMYCVLFKVFSVLLPRQPIQPAQLLKITEHDPVLLPQQFHPFNIRYCGGCVIMESRSFLVVLVSTFIRSLSFVVSHLFHSFCRYPQYSGLSVDNFVLLVDQSG